MKEILLVGDRGELHPSSFVMITVKTIKHNVKQR